VESRVYLYVHSSAMLFNLLATLMIAFRSQTASCQYFPVSCIYSAHWSKDEEVNTDFSRARVTLVVLIKFKISHL
jgi:hypothetical protein